MNLSNIFHSVLGTESPRSIARKEVDGFIQELNNRPRKGDPALHEKLHKLNEQALNPEALTDAYERHTQGEDPSISRYCGLNRVKDAVNAGQVGFARELAAQTMADGHYSESEDLAVRQMTNPPYQLKGYGPVLGQLLLGGWESNHLRNFAAAPNDGIRSWMVEQSPGKPVDLPAVQALGEKLFENGKLDTPGWNYAARLGSVFGTPIEKSAQFFLDALRGTDPDLRVSFDKDSSGSYRELARSQDSKSNQKPGPCEQAYLAGLEFARQKGLSDSAQARSLFPQK
jgi:hypothetical protein